MYHNTGLRFELLAAPLVRKGFVKNEKKCNYELYLVEMLNHSEWFSSRHKQAFIWSESQSNGECDTYSGDYGLDFKLIASTTELLARSVHSIQVTKEENGMFVYSERKQKKKPTTVYHIFFALKDKTLCELEEYRNNKQKSFCMEKDIRDFLKNLETKKNLLLFFCYRFNFVNDIKPNNAVDIIRWYLQLWYKSSFEYRKKYSPNYDTFLVTVYYDDFILMRVTGNDLEVIDIIPTSECTTYKLLQDYHPWG